MSDDDNDDGASIANVGGLSSRRRGVAVYDSRVGRATDFGLESVRTGFSGTDGFGFHDDPGGRRGTEDKGSNIEEGNGSVNNLILQKHIDTAKAY